VLTYLVFGTFVLIAVLVVVATVVFFRREDRTRMLYAESIAAGLDKPASLHPVIDPEVCIASGACVDACPEDVLGQIDGKTYLVQATSCIGHGRCHDVCPVNAISLVFGTAERGVDIPLLRAGYETNVDGIYVIGELGGMGLIRNAMRQGVQVMTAISEQLADPFEEDPEQVDVLIVGAGPAGIACAIKAVDEGKSFTLLEQYALGGSVTHYPRRKLIFSEVLRLPVVGRFGKEEMLKEELIAEFERVLLEAGIELKEQRRVTAVDGRFGSFVVTADAPSGREAYKARTVVLAIGRRGTPRTLGVPGEDSQRVVYRLSEPEQYRHKRVLVIGGGDSAVEAAVAVADVAGSEVHLSYRGESFYRVKSKNRAAIEEAVAKGKVTLHLATNVVRLDVPGRAQLTGADGPFVLEVDDVVVNIGGVLPTPFLESMGIRVETKHGEEVDVPKSSARLAKTVARATARLTRTSGRLGKGSDRRRRATGRLSNRLGDAPPLERSEGLQSEPLATEETAEELDPQRPPPARRPRSRRAGRPTSGRRSGRKNRTGRRKRPRDAEE